MVITHGEQILFNFTDKVIDIKYSKCYLVIKYIKYNVIKQKQRSKNENKANHYKLSGINSYLRNI